MEKAKRYKLIGNKKLQNSEVEIEAEISAEELAQFRVAALKHLQITAELPGFRKGHVPENMLIEKLGEMHILEEAAELALQDIYPEILVDEKIDAISRPSITITKLALGNPLVFKAHTAIIPAFDLPNYKKIAESALKKAEDILVTDEEMEKVVTMIVKAHHDATPNVQKDAPLPELTDELAKKFGPFENIIDFKQKVKESMLSEKKLDAKEKMRLGIIKLIVEKTDIPLPRVLIDSELERMLHQFEAEAKQAGTTLEKYLVEVKKTKEVLLKDWEPNAIERAKVELILGKIAVAEKIRPADEEIIRDVSRLLKEHPDADEERLRAYVTHILTNEKVFQFLEMGLN